MSHPSRPQAPGLAPRPRRQHRIESIQALEDRLVMAPVVTSTFRTAVFTPARTPTNAFLGTVTVAQTPLTNAPSPVTSVSEFATNAQFGGDIVKIKAGPGGEFGKGLYAISRGAGSNTNALNKPGVIYRLDPATGRSSLFFDLNSVISQLEPGATAAASVGASTGLVNWYDLAFDNEGYFDGKPSLFVSTADRADPNKNVVYRVAPDGTFLGAFVKFTSGQSSLRFNVNPTSILVPPPEQQTFLRGLFVGNGTPNAPTTDSTGAIVPPNPTSSNFTSLFFDANAFRPGQNLAANALPTGAAITPLNFGPQVALTAANVNYISPAYSAFTDFGTPGPPYDTNTGGIQGAPGLSGVQGVGGASTVGSFSTNSLTPANVGTPSGELLITNTTTNTGGATPGTRSLFQIFDINGGLTPAEVTALTRPATLGAPSGVDTASAVSTPFRRFQDIAFDQFGYFSSNAPLAGFGGTTGGGAATTTGDKLPYAGSLFVSDLATGLAVSVTSIAVPAVPAVPGVSPAIPAIPAIPVAIPIQGQGFLGVQVLPDGTIGPIVTNGNTTNGSNLGGRIIRIDPNGTVSEFATNFNTSRFQNSQSFIESSLSITFSADGTTLYAADNDGIWKFKTVTSLAGSTAGSIVGLNDLRTLGVPYDGQNSAVAVVDTGVDQNPSFRGRIATGQSILFNGAAGNQDTAPGVTTTTSTGTTSTAGSFPDGHGTLLAGVVAQFVPQATLEPVNVFSPAAVLATTPTGGGGGGANAVPSTRVSTSPQALYQGLQFTADHPFVADPVRRNKQDRVVAATLGFGTTQTFGNEVDAFRRFPQVTLALKNQLHRLRGVGITTIAPAGQFGGTSSGNTGGGGGGPTAIPTQNGLGELNGMSLPAVFNEVISVTGTYPFPIAPDANTTPLTNFIGLQGRFPVPFLLGGITTTGGGGGGAATTNVIGALVSQDSTIFKDKLLSSANRNVTTDFAAPALDVPTFGRLVAVTTTTVNGGTAGTSTSGLVNNPANLVFQQGGTSLSAAITSGSFALVASALDYFAALTPTGATTDAYLTQPVGARSLNFGPHVLKDLNAYANPDGINSILQWTAVPVADDPASFADANTARTATGGGGGGTGNQVRPPGGARLSIRTLQNRSYSRISVSNAIAAIEGTVALDYLFKHNTFDVIDTNHNGLITAQEIQNFVDAASSTGLPEAGAMARLLGGNARSPGSGNTGAGQTPDQPDVLQRRYNFFDYAANGSLKGVISIDALRQLSQKLLPQPGDFSVVDRTRSSAIRYLLSPSTVRATQDLQYIAPKAEFIPAQTIARYRGVSPLKFGVGRNANPLTSGPAISLFDVPTEPTKDHSSARTTAATTKAVTPTPTETPAPPASTPTPTPMPTAPAVSTLTATTPTPLISAPAVATVSNPTGRPVAAPPATAPVSTATASTGATAAKPGTFGFNDLGAPSSTNSKGAGAANPAAPAPAGDVPPTQAAATTTTAATATAATATAKPAATPMHPRGQTAAQHHQAQHPAGTTQTQTKSPHSFKKFVRSLGIPFLKKV